MPGKDACQSNGTNRPGRTGVWIRPNSDKLLLPARVMLMDRRRAGLPFRNSSKHSLTETFEKCSILFKIKKGENSNHRNTIKYFED